jgi:hypothetical protein
MEGRRKRSTTWVCGGEEGGTYIDLVTGVGLADIISPTLTGKLSAEVTV